MKWLSYVFDDEQKVRSLEKKDHSLIRSIARENPSLQGVIDVADINAPVCGQRTLDDGKL